MPVFDPSALPEQPDIIPPELRHVAAQGSGWSAKVPPAAVGMFVAAVAQWLSDPRFGVSVEVTAHDGASSRRGWTIDVRVPESSQRDDVQL